MRAVPATSRSSQADSGAGETKGSTAPRTSDVDMSMASARKASTETDGAPPLGRSSRTDTCDMRWLVAGAASLPWEPLSQARPAESRSATSTPRARTGRQDRQERRRLRAKEEKKDIRVSDSRSL